MLEDDLKAQMTGAPDAVFTLAVMARIEGRRFRRAMMTNLVLALAAAAVLALTMPVLQQVWQVAFAPRASNLVIGLALMVMSYAGLQRYNADA